MYWLNGIASKLSTANLRDNISNATIDDNAPVTNTFPQTYDLVQVAASPHASVFVTCTTSTIYLWSVKVVLQHKSAYLDIKMISLLAYNNIIIHWSIREAYQWIWREQEYTMETRCYFCCHYGKLLIDTINKCLTMKHVLIDDKELSFTICHPELWSAILWL